MNNDNHRLTFGLTGKGRTAAPSRLTIELEPHVVAWLEKQAAELAGELAGQGGELPADAVTAETLAAGFVTSCYEEWTGTTVEGDL